MTGQAGCADIRSLLISTLSRVNDASVTIHAFLGFFPFLAHPNPVIFSRDFPGDPLILYRSRKGLFFPPSRARASPPASVSPLPAWVYRAKGYPRQCVSNYMFLLEALVSCVASLFESAGQTGPRPASAEPKTPALRPQHRIVITTLTWVLRQTAVTLGMTPTRLP